MGPLLTAVLSLIHCAEALCANTRAQVKLKTISPSYSLSLQIGAAQNREGSLVYEAKFIGSHQVSPVVHFLNDFEEILRKSSS